jgi:hypothetical protein
VVAINGYQELKQMVVFKHPCLLAGMPPVFGLHMSTYIFEGAPQVSARSAQGGLLQAFCGLMPENDKSDIIASFLVTKAYPGIIVARGVGHSSIYGSIATFVQQPFAATTEGMGQGLTRKRHHGELL